MAEDIEKRSSVGSTDRDLALAKLLRERDELFERGLRAHERSLAAIPRVSLIVTDEDAMRFLVPIAYRIFEVVKTRFGPPWDRTSIPSNWAAAEGWATTVSSEEKRQSTDREEASFALAREVVRRSHGDEAAADPAKVRFALKALTQKSWDDLASATRRPQAWPGVTLREIEEEAEEMGITFSVLRRGLDPTGPKAIALESDLAMTKILSKADVLADVDRAATANGAIGILRRLERRAGGAADLPGGRRYVQKSTPLLLERRAFEEQLPSPALQSRRDFYARFARDWDAAGLFPAACPFCGVWYARTDRRIRGCRSCVSGAYQRLRRAQAAARIKEQTEANVRTLRADRNRHLMEEHLGRRPSDCATCDELDDAVGDARGRRRVPRTVPVEDLVGVEERRERRARGATR